MDVVSCLISTKTFIDYSTLSSLLLCVMSVNFQIDEEVILHIDDEELKKYIPLYGDRVAAKHFCQTKLYPSQLSKKDSLLDRLRSSTLFKRKASTVADSKGEKLMGNKNAKKRYHQVELGWMHFSKGINRYQQVNNQEVVEPESSPFLGTPNIVRFSKLGLIYSFLRQVETPSLETKETLVLYFRTFHAPKLSTWI